MELSNVKVCPRCNSQNIITEYDWVHDVYIILCDNCGERREVKGEDFIRDTSMTLRSSLQWQRLEKT